MKTLIKSIVAVSAVAAAAPAMAIAPGTVPAGNQLYISGATATNQALYQLTLLAAGGACADGTADVFIDVTQFTLPDPDDPQLADDATDANDQFLVACTGAAGTTLASLTGGVLIAKESNGGSNNGTRNVARSIALDFLNPAAPTCETDGIAVGDPGGPLEVGLPGDADGDGLIEYVLHTGCTGVTSVVPDAGIADVEAALFTTTTAADIAALTPSPLFQIIFAPAVSLNLYRALQTAQGLPLDDLPTSVPNMTRGQLAGIFNSTIGDWTDFQVDGAAGAGPDFATGATAPGGFGGAVTNVFICRRGEDSGTQASFTSFVLNERCNGSVPGFVGPTTAACLDNGCDYVDATFGFDFIFAGDGSGDVRACLDAKNDLGGDPLDPNAPAGVYGIGVLSTNTSVNNTDRRIRFIGVDGAAPTLASVANGGYHFVTENVLNVLGAGPDGRHGYGCRLHRRQHRPAVHHRWSERRFAEPGR